MSQISNISINISLKTLPLSQKGFGLALVAGDTPRHVNYELDVLSNSAGIKWRAVTLGDVHIQIQYLAVGHNTALTVTRTGAGTSNSPYIISVALATDSQGNVLSTAAQIKTAAEAVSEVGGQNKIVNLSLLHSPGDGVATAFDALHLVDPTESYLEIQDPDNLLDPAIGYTPSSPEYKLAAAIFSQTPRVDKIAILKINSFATIVSELADLRNDGFDDWYWLLATTRDGTEIKAISAYLNTLEKCYIPATSDQGAVDALLGDERTLLIISNHAEDYPDGAIFGRCGGMPIGSVTWDSKALNGQKNSDVTMSEQSQILAKHGNLIREMGGVNVFWKGTTMSGQYIDIINGRDYLKARLQEAYHSLKINNNKISMTVNGLKLIEATLREVFRDCGKRGIIARVEDDDGRSRSDLNDYQYRLKMPETISDIPANDRANRKVSNIIFSATISGGINEIEISGAMGV